MLLKTLFPDFVFKSKHHFLIHYPHLIMEFGPLTTSWSMRYKAKHFFFKRVPQSAKNFMNLPFILAKKHQQLQCHYNSSRSFGKRDP